MSEYSMVQVCRSFHKPFDLKIRGPLPARLIVQGEGPSRSWDILRPLTESQPHKYSNISRMEWDDLPIYAEMTPVFWMGEGQFVVLGQTVAKGQVRHEPSGAFDSDAMNAWVDGFNALMIHKSTVPFPGPREPAPFDVRVTGTFRDPKPGDPEPGYVAAVTFKPHPTHSLRDLGLVGNAHRDGSVTEAYVTACDLCGMESMTAVAHGPPGWTAPINRALLDAKRFDAPCATVMACVRAIQDGVARKWFGLLDQGLAAAGFQGFKHEGDRAADRILHGVDPAAGKDSTVVSVAKRDGADLKFLPAPPMQNPSEGLFRELGDQLFAKLMLPALTTPPRKWMSLTTRELVDGQDSFVTRVRFPLEKATTEPAPLPPNLADPNLWMDGDGNVLISRWAHRARYVEETTQVRNAGLHITRGDAAAAWGVYR